MAPEDQGGTDQPQSNQVEDITKQLSERGYKVTEEYSNTGQLSKVSGEHPQRKTVWDWLQLIIIPLVLLIASFGLGFEQNQINNANNDAQKMREQTATAQQHMSDQLLAQDQQQEATLKSYLDKMSDLLLTGNLIKSHPGDEVRNLARARTLVTLRSLNVDQPPRSPIFLVRKGIILQFLYEAGLISKGKVIVNLDGADLSYTYLPKVKLNLSEIDLSNANLINAILSTAVLKGANLTGANLAFADLTGSDLTGSDLSKASLQQTLLDTAILKDATVTQEQLQVTSHIGMTCPNGSISSGKELPPCK